jgi:hypothetical protein
MAREKRRVLRKKRQKGERESAEEEKTETNNNCPPPLFQLTTECSKRQPRYISISTGSGTADDKMTTITAAGISMGQGWALLQEQPPVGRHNTKRRSDTKSGSGSEL